MPNGKKNIVVVGGGAGGLKLAAQLGARLGKSDEYDVILLERNRTHIWKPLLHEVAAGALDANLDEVGYRAHCRRWRYRFFLGSFAGLDRARREVVIAPLVDDDGEELMGEHRLRYEYLVLALGSVTNDFGTTGVKDHCLFLDNRKDADRFRQKLLDRCISLSRRMTNDPSLDDHVRIAIVGGGATGVELAAELYNAAAALRHYGLEGFDESRLKVTLLEAGPRILPALPEELSESAHGELEQLGVEVVTNAMVREVDDRAFHTADGKSYPSSIRVWAAGVKGQDFLADLDGLETNRAHQFVVRPSLQTTRDPNIFAIGDCASLTPEGADRPIPPRAQAANQMASTARRNLLALLRGRPTRPFVYRDHGSLVSLSRYSTVGSLMGNLMGGRMAVEGRIARMVYVSLYQKHLLGIHGWVRGALHILVAQFNSVIRPKLKLH